MAEEVIIKVQNLSKNYKLEGTDREIPVLRGVNLEIKKNDFAIIYGPSGSGKSTLLHHIIGLEVPYCGDIWIKSTNIVKLSPEERAIFRAKNFGMVYQLWYWIKSLNVWENVAIPLLIRGQTLQQAKRPALEALTNIGMQKYAYKKPTQLSGGEQQRVGLARALVNNPLIILADEPTGNLDTHSADAVMQILQELNIKHKRTIIMVTHNLVYLPLATKTVAMKDGTVVSADTTGVKEQIKEELKRVI